MNEKKIPTYPRVITYDFINCPSFSPSLMILQQLLFNFITDDRLTTTILSYKITRPTAILSCKIASVNIRNSKFLLHTTA